MHGKGWTAAKDLQPGDRLRTLDESELLVEKVFDTGEWQTVYNARIADYHTYFVRGPGSTAFLWAHNDCHPIVSKYKNMKRGWSQNWTIKSQEILKKAKIGKNSKLNKVDISPHWGPHTELYHKRIYQRLKRVSNGKSGDDLHNAVAKELERIASKLRMDPNLLTGVGLL